MLDEKEVSSDETGVEQTSEAEEQSEDTTEETTAPAEDTTEEASKDTSEEHDADYWKNKYHAYKRRTEEDNTPSTTESQDDVVKKSDQEKANERLAFQSLETSEDELSEELLANKDDILAYYVPRHGRLTKEDILEDLKDAHAVWKRSAKPKAAKPEAEVAKVAGTGGKSPTEAAPERKRVLHKSKDISEWYD